MNKCTERIFNGLVKENPTFVLMLGMCPTLAVTTSAINGIGMGLSTTAVLIMSNMLISMLRKIIPDSVRMPAFTVDRCKLYHSRPRGELCIKESCTPVHFRRCRHGAWIYGRSDFNRYRERTDRRRTDLRIPGYAGFL